MPWVWGLGQSAYVADAVCDGDRDSSSRKIHREVIFASHMANDVVGFGLCAAILIEPLELSRKTELLKLVGCGDFVDRDDGVSPFAM